MSNLLSELLGLGTQILVCFDQNCGEVRSEKIHIINIINLESKTCGIYTHIHTRQAYNQGAHNHKCSVLYESNSQYQPDCTTG